jgi:SAM-dependent methyltransferase
MPIKGDRETWRRNIELVNFVNTYYVMRDIEALPDVKTVLMVGSGKGLDVPVLTWRGFKVSTLDIDPAFEPDFVGSVDNLGIFKDAEFDVAVASHVLEHLAEPYLDGSLKELARVARYSIVYLPRDSWLPIWLSLKLDTRADFNFVLEPRNPFHRPDGVTPRYMSGQHFWHLGMKGFTVCDLKRRMSKYFEVLTTYRNPDRPVSQNFVLRSRVNA